MNEPNWDEINKKKEIDIAVGQAVNIVAQKGLTPTDDNIKQVLDWVEFILKCKDQAKQIHFENQMYNLTNGGEDI